MAKGITELDTVVVEANDAVLGKRARGDVQVQASLSRRPPPPTRIETTPEISSVATASAGRVPTSQNGTAAGSDLPTPSSSTNAVQPRNAAPQDTASTSQQPVQEPKDKEHCFGSAGPFPRYHSSKAVVSDKLTCVEICEQHPLSINGEIAKDFLRHGWTAPDIFRHLPQDIREGLFNYYGGNRQNSVMASRLTNLKRRLKDADEWNVWMSSTPRRFDGRTGRTAAVPSMASAPEPLRPTKVSLELAPDQRLSFNTGSAADIEYRRDLVSTTGTAALQGISDESAESDLEELLPAITTPAALPAPQAQPPVINTPTHITQATSTVGVSLPAADMNDPWQQRLAQLRRMLAQNKPGLIEELRRYETIAQQKDMERPLAELEAFREQLKKFGLATSADSILELRRKKAMIRSSLHAEFPYPHDLVLAFVEAEDEDDDLWVSESKDIDGKSSDWKRCIG